MIQMAKGTAIYQNGDITITQRNVFGKIGLSGYNKANGATVTVFLTENRDIGEVIAGMVTQLEKCNAINLTPRLEKLEAATLARFN
jgi:hypothetical protein